MAGYPASMPAYEQADLNSLSSQGKLFGVSPLVLAGIAQNESGFEDKGAGINPEGYGGYFGLGENSSYSFDGTSFTDTPALLDTQSDASFQTQAQTAAAEVASLLAKYGSLQPAINAYVSGSPTGAPGNGDFIDASNILGGNPVSSSGSYPVNGASTTTVPDGSSVPTAQLTSVTGDIASGLLGVLGVSKTNAGSLVARALIVIVALILLAVGLDKLFSSSSPTDIVLQAPQSVQGQATRTMTAPGATAPPPRSSAPAKGHPLAHDAADVGTVAAAG